MSKSRLTALLLSLALLITSIGITTSVAMADDAATDLTLWVFADTHARYYEYISTEYSKENPDVSITVEVMNNNSLRDRLMVCIAAGGEGAPDMVDVEQGTFPSFMSEEYMCFEPIEGLLERDELSDAMVESRLNLYAYDNHYYGLEHALCPVMMIYRPDLFEQNGVAIPDTWEAYKAAAYALKDQGIYITTLSDMRTVIPGIVSMLALSSGNDIVTADGTFQLTEGYLNILDEFLGLINDECIYVYETDSDNYYEISESRVATQFVADWAAGWLRDNVPEQNGMWAMTYLPKYGENAARVSVNGGTGLCMIKYNDDAKKETCWDFMKYAMLDSEHCVIKYEMVSLYPPVYAAMEACNTPVEYYGNQNLGELWQEVAAETPTQYQAAFRSKFSEVTKTYLYDYVEGNMTIEEFGEAVKADMAEFE